MPPDFGGCFCGTGPTGRARAWADGRVRRGTDTRKSLTRTQSCATKLIAGTSGKGGCRVARDESSVGRMGVMTIATRGSAGPGEVEREDGVMQ
jgi:hypothetical protein